MQEDVECMFTVPNHACDVLKELHRLQQNGLGCDVALVLDDGTFTSAHKHVLYAASPYFRESLRLDDTSTATENLYLSETSDDVLKCVLHYIYSGSLCVPRERLPVVLQLCDRLLLSNVAEMCRQHLLQKPEIKEERRKNVESPGMETSNTMSRNTCETINVQNKDNRSLQVENVKRSSQRKRSVDIDVSETDVNKMNLNKGDIQPDKTDASEQIPILKVPKLSISLKKLKDKLNLNTLNNRTKEKMVSVTKKSRRCKRSNQLDSVRKILGKGIKVRKKESKKLEHNFINIKQNLDNIGKDEGKEMPYESDISEDNGFDHEHAGNSQSDVENKQVMTERPKKGKTNKKVAKAASGNGFKLKFPKNCSICQKSVPSYKIFTLHMKEHKMEKTAKFPIQCHICQELFPSHKTFTAHMKEHQSPKSAKFLQECCICHESLTSNKTYKIHMKKHHLENGGKKSTRQEHWPCTVCGRMLTSAVRQACHQYSKHGIPYDSQFKLHACTSEGCKYVTASKHYLQIHMQGRHGNERPHVCEFCGKGFKLPSALVTHVNIHTNEKIYKCEDCNLTFNQKGGLDIHIKKHHKGQESWNELCHLCSEKFLHKAELCWHMYTAHQIAVPERYKVFSCELCNYQTIRKNKLERHMDAHQDKRSWVCSVCGKKFVTKSYLNRHIKYHGEKTFKCDFDGCMYACVDQVGLKKHMRLMHTHKNYKPFLCSICPYKTGLRGNLDKHIRTVHNLEVVTKHTVHLKMKFRDRRSGDIINKDGKLIEKVVDTRTISHRCQEPNGTRDEPVSHVEDEYQDKPDDSDMRDDALYIQDDDMDNKAAEHMIAMEQLSMTSLPSASSDSIPITSTSTPSLLPEIQQYLYNPATASFGLATNGQLPVPYSVTGEPRMALTTQVTSNAGMYLTLDPLQNMKYPEYY